MATILQIETATQVCSVAIAQNGKTIQLKEEMAPNIHASSVTLFIDEVMKKAKIAYKDLDAIAVSKGPGSYTGLRIGVSSAKGMCFALEKPLIAVSTLQMMAYGFTQENPGYQGIICPMIDARRMEVFTALYADTLATIEDPNAKIIDTQSYKDVLNHQHITFIGDGAEKCKAEIVHQNALFNTTNFNSAAYMSALAFEAFKLEKFEDVAYFEPFYLKDFVFTTPKKNLI